MIHLKKINLLRPSILNLFWKAHFSPVRFHIPSNKKRPPIYTVLTEVNSTNILTHTPCKYDFVANILLQHVNTKSIPWDEVTKNVFDEQVKSNSEQSQLPAVSSAILQTCMDLKLETIGLSYCKYLVNEIKNLSLFKLFLIMKFLFTLGEKAGENKELLKVLLNEIKPYLGSNFAYAALCVKVLCSDYDCWKDLVDNYPSFKDGPTEVVSVLATEAFRYNEYETGWKILNANQFALKDPTFVSYLEYCIREAEKGRFSLSLLNKLVERSQKSFYVFPEIHTLPLLRTLVSTLNSDPNKTHVWEIYETKVNHFNMCLNCGEKLDTLKITEEEFTKLRDHVLNDVLISSNIHIRTSEKELLKFSSFLKDIKYDVVLDGLNIVYKRLFQLESNKQENIVVHVINYFKKKNMKMLFIGKGYLKKYRFFEYIKKNCEIFFAHSLSDDDALLMYAALYGGINTHFFTSDFLRGYHVLLEDEEMQIIFRKWNIIRRYSFLPKSLVLTEPKIHSFLPQQTTIKEKLQEKGEVCWHFPVGCNSLTKMSVRGTVCYCLWRKSLDRNSSSTPSLTNKQEIESVEENKS